MPRYLPLLLLLLLLWWQLPQSQASCPAPFSMQAGLCVFVNPAQSYSWCSANQQCEAIGGELVNAYSSVEALVGSSIPDANCGCSLWVGLSDLADERNMSRAGWQRVNGRGDFPLNASLFQSQEPSGSSSENCLRRHGGGNRLADVKCTSSFGFVCEFVSETRPLTAAGGLWMATSFNRVKYNSAYCFADLLGVSSVVRCTAAAMRAGSSRHVLYNGKLSTCRLLQFSDSQVEAEIETSPDWVKFSLV